MSKCQAECDSWLKAIELDDALECVLQPESVEQKIYGDLTCSPYHEDPKRKFNILNGETSVYITYSILVNGRCGTKARFHHCDTNVDPLNAGP